MIAIINGPNLNLQGKRQPEIYGNKTFEILLSELRECFPDVSIEYLQSNCEGKIIDFIQQLGNEESGCQGVVINPGAYAHYSYAIADALADIEIPVVEVHISNIFSREDFRRQSITAPQCKGFIAGLGLEGYTLAVKFLLKENQGNVAGS